MLNHTDERKREKKRERERETFKCQNLGGEKRCRKSREAERVRADVELHGGLVNSVSIFSHGNRDISPRVARKFRVEILHFQSKEKFSSDRGFFESTREKNDCTTSRNRVSITVGRAQ